MDYGNSNNNNNNNNNDNSNSNRMDVQDQVGPLFPRLVGTNNNNNGGGGSVNNNNNNNGNDDNNNVIMGAGSSEHHRYGGQQQQQHQNQHPSHDHHNDHVHHQQQQQQYRSTAGSSSMMISSPTSSRHSSSSSSYQNQYQNNHNSHSYQHLHNSHRQQHYYNASSSSSYSSTHHDGPGAAVRGGVRGGVRRGDSLTNHNIMNDYNQCLTWSRVNVIGGTIPPPRSGAASVIVKDKLYVFGGYGGGTGRLDDFYSYDLNKNIWEEVQVLSDKKPGRRENNGVVISDSNQNIVLFGGYNGQAWLNDLWKFDINTKRWTCIQESSDTNSAAASSSSSASSGGNNNDGAAAAAAAALPDESNAAVGDVAGNSNGNNNNIILGVGNHQVKGKVPSRRFGYVSVVHDGKFILFGGFDGNRWLNDMYVFHFESKTWTEIIQPTTGNAVIPSARSCPAWSKDYKYVYVHGGYDGVERKNDFFAFNLLTYRWIEMPSFGPNQPSPRYFHSCCLYGNKMYLYAGYSGHERLADMYAYDFETAHWNAIDCTRGQAPTGRSSLVAQVYENSLYVFAGYSGQSVLNDFYKFRLKPIGIPPSNLISDFYRLINNTELADICFRVENKYVYAHRSILAIRSEYFQVMLCGHMKEAHNRSVITTNNTIQQQQQPPSSRKTRRSTMSKSKSTGNHDDGSAVASVAGGVGSSSSSSHMKCDDDDDDDDDDDVVYDDVVNVDDNDDKLMSFNGTSPIELPDVSYIVFLKVLEFLYTDTVTDVSLEIGIHLLIASEQFMLDRLKSLCEDFIRRDININNVVNILVASHRHNATGLKDIALEFILNNLNNPIVFGGLSDLRSEPDLLLEIIKRNSGNTTTTGTGSATTTTTTNNSMNNNNNNNSIMNNNNNHHLIGVGGAGQHQQQMHQQQQQIQQQQQQLHQQQQQQHHYNGHGVGVGGGQQHGDNVVVVHMPSGAAAAAAAHLQGHNNNNNNAGNSNNNNNAGVGGGGNNNNQQDYNNNNNNGGPFGAAQQQAANWSNGPRR